MVDHCKNHSLFACLLHHNSTWQMGFSATERPYPDSSKESEDEAVPTTEYLPKEESSLPHHVDEILRHVKRLSGEVGTICVELVAVEFQGPALVEGSLINCDKKEVSDQELGVLPFSQALKEEI